MRRNRLTLQGENNSMESLCAAERALKGRDLGDTTKACTDARMMYRRVISCLMVVARSEREMFEVYDDIKIGISAIVSYT